MQDDTVYNREMAVEAHLGVDVRSEEEEIRRESEEMYVELICARHKRTGHRNLEA